MADNDLKSPLLKGEPSDLKSFEPNLSEKLFKDSNEVGKATGMKEDFSKATSYIRDLRPQMIDTPFQGSSLALTKEERFYVFGSRQGRIGIADRETKQVILDRDLKQGSIWTLILINNDKYVLAAGAAGSVKKFLYEDLSDVDEYVGHTNEINFIKVNADEKIMYTCSDDRTVREWDLDASPDTERSTVLYEHTSVVYCIDLSLDGTHIVSASCDCTVKVYSLEKREEEATLEGHESSVWCVKVSSKKSVIASGDQYGVIMIWQFGTWNLLKSLTGHTDRVRYMDMALDERFIVTGSLDNTIKIWDLKRPRKEITLKGHTDWVKFTILSRNQDTIFSISDDCKVASWKIPKFDNQMNFEHTESFSRLDVPCSSIFAKTDDSIQEYSLATGKKVSQISLAGVRVITYSYNSLGTKLYVFGYENDEKILIIYSLANSEPISRHPLNVEEITSAFVLPNEEQFAVGQSVRLYIFRISDMFNTNTFRSHKTEITSITSTPDSLRLFSASKDSIIKYYDLTKQQEIGALELEDSINYMQVSKCNNYLFVSYSNKLLIYGIKRMQKFYEINDFYASKILFSNDLQSFFYNSPNNLYIRDLNTFEIITSLKFSNQISDYVLSPDESVCIITSGNLSTIFSNPLKCSSVSIFGDWENTYEYVEYVNEIIHSKAIHKPEFDDWVIEPFHINTLHLYAYYNQPELLYKAVTLHSPFYMTRTSHTPLEVSLDKGFMDCVEQIYKALKLRIESGDDHAFYYIGHSLISLNNSGFENLHRIYELTLQQSKDSTLPRFCGENVELPYGITSPSPIVEPQEFGNVFQDEGTAIVFAKSSFRISMNIGSQDSTDLLESIIDCTNENIYSTTVVQMILKEKWLAVRWFFILQTAVYCLYLISLAVYSSLFLNDKFFLLLPFFISLVLFLYEIAQMYCNGLEYFRDPWNFIDVFRGTLLILYCALVWTNTDTSSTNPLTFANETFSLLVLSSWLKGITYFRVFEKTRYLINLIMEATVDIIAFFVILFYSTIAFTLIYQSLHMTPEQSLSDQFAASFKLNLGDLSVETDGLMMRILFLIVSIINPIIMLNLLISIMGDTYGRVKEGRIVADTRELAGMILEVEGIMGWRRHLNEEFFVKIICEESYLKPQDESVISKLKKLKDKIQQIIGQVATTTDEVLGKISEVKQTILNAI